ARRRLREAARALLPELGLGGIDYVLVARAATVEASWGALLDDLRNALIRLRAALEAGGGRSHLRRARTSNNKPGASRLPAATESETVHMAYRAPGSGPGPEEIRNLILFLVISMVVLGLWEFFYARPLELRQQQQRAAIEAQTQAAQPQTPA